MESKESQIIAVMNQKGGSGKTTTAVNLAAAFSESGAGPVLVVDLDPQGSASSWLAAADDGRGLLAALEDGKAPAFEALVRPTCAPGVSIIPSGPLLARADRVLAGEPGAELILKRALQPIAARWRLVLLDCPPALNLLTMNALTAATELLVPVETSTMALAGLLELRRTVAVVQERLAPELRYAGILVCRYDARTSLSRLTVERLRQAYPREVLDTVIRESVQLREAYGAAQPISVYAPRSRGAEDYLALAGELRKETHRAA